MKHSFYLLIIFFFLFSCNKPVAESPPPNIVFIFADDMGYGDLASFNENSQIPTEHIDQLAKGGMRFTDAHAAAAWCVPSRYALLTGEYPFRNQRKYQEGLLAPGKKTIANSLKNAGYQTGMVGKWHQGIINEKTPNFEADLVGGPVDHGFDYYFGIPASLDIPPYYFIRGKRMVEPLTDTIPSSPGFAPPQQDWKIQGPYYTGGYISENYNHGDVLNQFGEEAENFIAEKGGKDKSPFFLYLALPAPHTPWLPDEAHKGKSKVGGYGDYVLQVDDLVGNVMAKLEAQGIAENTLVIFTSDNGPVWYPEDFDKYGHNAVGALSGMKGDALEGGHRMPFVAHWPAKIPENTVNKSMICFTDIMATLMDASGVGEEQFENIPEDSKSFYAGLLDPNHESSRNTLVSESNRKAYSYRKGDWKLIMAKGTGGFSEIYDPTIPDKNPYEGQLYNLANDLGEKENLYDSNPEKVAELMAEWEKLRGEK